MRSLTWPGDASTASVTVVTRNCAHSRRMVGSDFCFGLPSSPIITRLNDSELSRLVCASRTVISSSAVWRLDLGSNTRRTAWSLSDSSDDLVQHRQHQCLVLHLLLRQGLLVGPDLGVGQLLDLLQDFFAGGAVRQFVDHHLPLAARHLLDLPARAHLQRAASGAVALADLVRPTK